MKEKLKNILSVPTYTWEEDQLITYLTNILEEKGYPYYRVKVKEINNPPESTVLDKIKATAKKMFSPNIKRGGGAGADEYIAPKHAYRALQESIK